MDDFERQLKNALARKDAPEWFEAKVMAGIRRAGESHARGPALQWRWAAALVATVLAIGGVTWQHERTVRERAAGEAAKTRLELALKITRAKLQRIEQKLNEVERDN
jgi:hypothetical protein